MLGWTKNVLGWTKDVFTSKSRLSCEGGLEDSERDGHAWIGKGGGRKLKNKSCIIPLAEGSEMSQMIGAESNHLKK